LHVFRKFLLPDTSDFLRLDASVEKQTNLNPSCQ
jgi:hypothetical protein